jgi:hypothetical protein
MKKVDKAFRLSQAAGQLGTTRYVLLRLCQLSMIEAERTPGGHWRIPCAEIERLKAEGLPVVPALISAAEEAVDSPGRHALSKKTIASDEKVIRLQNQAEALRHQLEVEELQRQIRAAKRAEREEEQERRRALRRERWLKRWLDYSMARVPIGYNGLAGRIRTRVIDALDHLPADTPAQEVIDEIIFDETMWQKVRFS